MKVDGVPFRTIWLASDGVGVEIIDQTRLPHEFSTITLRSVEDAARALSDMWVRGAPLIGATAAYGVALAMHADPSDDSLHSACRTLYETRPTAVNLPWAVRRMQRAREEAAAHGKDLEEALLLEAHAIAREDAMAERTP